MSAKMASAAFLISEDKQWQQLGSGVERKILGYDEHLMMVDVRFEKGAVGSLHHHVHRQVSMLLQANLK